MFKKIDYPSMDDSCLTGYEEGYFLNHPAFYIVIFRDNFTKFVQYISVKRLQVYILTTQDIFFFIFSWLGITDIQQYRCLLGQILGKQDHTCSIRFVGSVAKTLRLVRSGELMELQLLRHRLIQKQIWPWGMSLLFCSQIWLQMAVTSASYIKGLAP